MLTRPLLKGGALQSEVPPEARRTQASQGREGAAPGLWIPCSTGGSHRLIPSGPSLLLSGTCSHRSGAQDACGIAHMRGTERKGRNDSADRMSLWEVSDAHGKLVIGCALPRNRIPRIDCNVLLRPNVIPDTECSHQTRAGYG